MSTNNNIDTIINERKAQSIVYQKWQASLALKERIMLEAGTQQCPAFERVKKVCEVWAEAWKRECDSIIMVPSDEALRMLEAAEAEVGLGDGMKTEREEEEEGLGLEGYILEIWTSADKGAKGWVRVGDVHFAREDCESVRRGFLRHYIERGIACPPNRISEIWIGEK